MPELPEVEHARRSLLRWLKSPVIAAHAEPTRIFRGAERKAFEMVRGKIKRIERKGKQLLLVFDHGAVRSHLGMTGKWVRRKSADEKYSRAHFELADGSFIHYRDPRMFGRLEPTDVQSLDADALGPDALTITAKQLASAFARTKLPIKVALMDQARVAGIGNIQAAEALWRAKLSPFEPASKVSQWAALARGIKATLHYTLKAQGAGEIIYVEEDASTNPFKVYDRKGKPCSRCGTQIATKTQAGRTTYYCPHCQHR